MCWGHVFSGSDTTDVPPDDAGRYRKHPLFEEENGGSETKPGGLSKTELIALAEECNVAIDKRWSAAKIAEHLQGLIP
jgi:hypothetical protein